MTSIFDYIERAEASDSDISVPAEVFLDLVDIWISCGYLISQIESGKDNEASKAILKIAEIYSKLGEKYAEHNQQ